MSNITLDIDRALQLLADYKYVLSYSKALEICYLYSPLFFNKPYFPKHFKPFESMRHRTFYYINDYYLFSLNSDDRKHNRKALEIIYVIVVNITPEEIQLFDDLNNRNIRFFKENHPRYELASLLTYDSIVEMKDTFNENYGFIYELDFVKAMECHDIVYDDYAQIAIFVEDLSR